MQGDAGYWLFHGPNLILAAMLYTLLGRYVLSLFFRPNSDLVIWRVFTQITNPVLRAVRLVTPAMVSDGVVMIAAVFWLIIARVLWLLIAAMYGFLPRIGG